MGRWVIGGIGALLLILLVLLWDHDSKKSPAASDAPHEFAPSPEPEKRQPPAVDSPALEQQREQPSEPEPVQAEAQPSEPEQKVERPTVMGPLEVLKRVYADDSNDPKASETEEAIRSAFGPDFLPEKLYRSVTCRRVVCKIAMVWTEAYPHSAYGLAMLTAAKVSGIIAMEPAPEPDRNGELLVELYVLRKGYTLEDIE